MTTPESFQETWRNIAATFLKLGITSYGGPAIMGIMQTELQESGSGSLVIGFWRGCRW